MTRVIKYCETPSGFPAIDPITSLSNRRTFFCDSSYSSFVRILHGPFEHEGRQGLQRDGSRILRELRARISKKVSSNMREFPKESETEKRGERERDRVFGEGNDQKLSNYFHGARKGVSRGAQPTETIHPAVKSVEVKDYRLREFRDISSRVNCAAPRREVPQPVNFYFFAT